MSGLGSFAGRAHSRANPLYTRGIDMDILACVRHRIHSPGLVGTSVKVDCAESLE